MHAPILSQPARVVLNANSWEGWRCEGRQIQSARGLLAFGAPHALEALGGVDPRRAIFVDDFAANVEAAEALGFRGVLMADDYLPALAEVERLTA